MTTTWNSAAHLDEAVVAIKQLAATSSGLTATSTSPYRQAFAYDWLGNL